MCGLYNILHIIHPSFINTCFRLHSILINIRSIASNTLLLIPIFLLLLPTCSQAVEPEATDIRNEIYISLWIRGFEDLDGFVPWALW